MPQLQSLAFSPATSQQLSLVHDPAYIDILRMLCEEGFTFVGDPETSICAASYDVAALATGGVLAACDAAVSGEIARAFCAVRPPGHHAEVDQAMGFCLLNHVAIAAEHLVRHHGLARVAIVDIDAHHGNGTQHFFESRGDVFYVSLHERPESLCFPGTGHRHEIGLGAGRGWTLNIPLDRGSGIQEYGHALRHKVVPALDAFRPDFILLSAGFDALMWDRVSNLSLEPSDFGPITEAIVRVADRYAQGRVVSVLEGGYDLGHLAPAVVAHLRALLATA